MTHISVFIEEGVPVGIVAKGHSGYAECGVDIVCSAISTLLFTLAIGIKEVLTLEDAVFRATPQGPKDEGNFFEIRWPRSRYPDLRILAETVILGLRRLEIQYSNNLCVTEVHIHDSV